MSASPSPPLEGLRILEVTERYPPALGGVERHVHRLAEELTRAGAEVEVVTTDLVRDRPFERASFSDADARFPVRRHRALEVLPGPRGLGVMSPRLLGDLLRTRCDVIHAHAFARFPTWAGRLARALRGSPLVITPHSDAGADTRVTRTWSRFVARSVLRGADRTIALSPTEAERLARLGVPADRIAVIPNGIDLEEFPAERRATSGANPLRVLFVGRLDPAHKGLDTLVEGFARVADDWDLCLRVVGPDWGGRQPMRDRARALGVDARVEIVGEVPRAELLEEYRRADVFVLPSRFDSFPIVLLEAMAAGLPVVATRVGGVPDVVEDGTTARLVPPDDVGALAHALASLAAEPGLRARYGAAGRHRATRFAWPSLRTRYADLFAALARGG